MKASSLVVAVLAGGATLGALQAQDGFTVERRKDLDKGASESVDPAALTREYSRFKAAFSAVVEKAAAPTMLDGAYDAGLPACRGRQVREVALATTLPARFGGQRLAFISSRNDLPELIANDPDAGILVVKAPNLRALGDAASAAKRTFSAGTKELAASVGVKCYPSWVEIKPNRKEAVVHEGE